MRVVYLHDNPSIIRLMIRCHKTATYFYSQNARRGQKQDQLVR